MPWLNRDRTPIKLRGQEAPPAPVPDAEELLASVAAALTACDAAGYEVKLKHGAVMTRVGYVLPLGDGEWCARTLNWSPFSPPPGDDLDD
jgi:hypothetical protein